MATSNRPKNEPDLPKLSMAAHGLLQAAATDHAQWEQGAITLAHTWPVRSLQMMGAIAVSFAQLVGKGHGTDASLVIREAAENVRRTFRPVQFDCDVTALSSACEGVMVQLLRPERRKDGLKDALSHAGEMGGDVATLVMTAIARMVARRTAELVGKPVLQLLAEGWFTEREQLRAEGFDMTGIE
jgi:hypothetical protein